MPYAPNDFDTTLLLYDDRTVTYYKPDGKPICMGYIRQDRSRYCQQPAGWRTEHPGTGKCWLHGGNIASMPYPKPGFKPNKRYQNALPKRMQAEYERLYNDPTLMDLTPELTLLKTMLTSFLQGCNEEAMESPEVIAFAAGLVNSVVKAIGQIERIQSSQVLTFSAARLMMTRAIAVAQNYIPQERMQAFVQEWKAAQQMPGLLEGPNAVDDILGEEDEQE